MVITDRSRGEEWRKPETQWARGWIWNGIWDLRAERLDAPSRRGRTDHAEGRRYAAGIEREDRSACGGSGTISRSSSRVGRPAVPVPPTAEGEVRSEAGKGLGQDNSHRSRRGIGRALLESARNWIVSGKEYGGGSEREVSSIGSGKELGGWLETHGERAGSGLQGVVRRGGDLVGEWQRIWGYARGVEGQPSGEVDEDR